MRCLMVAVFFAAACAGPAAPPAISPMPSPPPMPPPSQVPTTSVSGRVLSSDGQIVSDALVSARAANAGCVAAGGEVGGSTDESGNFNIAIEGSADCVLIEARSGGAAGRLATEKARDVTVRLEAPPPLTGAEAERLVALFSMAIHDPAVHHSELALYVAQGPEALRVALEQHRQLLGRVTEVREVEPSYTPSSAYRHHTFRLTGTTKRTLHVDVHQEALTRLHSALLDYGSRSERFMSSYVRAIAAGDAVRLARVLSPDDVDFPVDEARQMIIGYRMRFRDTATIRHEFVDVDETRHSITWRLRGPAANGGESSEEVVLRFGDGLIGKVED